MIINNTTSSAILYPTFKGKQKHNDTDISAVETTTPHKRSSFLPGLVLATAGFLTSGVLVQKGYDALDDSPRVESELTEFNNRNDAIQYATDKITSRLNAKNPREYLVYVDEDNNILGEYVGNSGSVYGDLLFYDMLKTKLFGYKYTTLHGHPEHDGYSTPLSFNDFEILNNNNAINEIVAINNDGEKSILKKNENFKEIDDETIYNLFTDYWGMLKEASKESLADKWEDVGKTVKNGFAEYTYSENEVILEYQKTLDGVKTIHNFWKENAPKLNLTYETDYSYLD